MLEKDHKNFIDFNNKIFCAPMVRVSVLPFRRIAFKYGCDIAFCEELVDKKLLNCVRKVVKRKDDDDLIEWRETKDENSKIIYQYESSHKKNGKFQILHIGTNDDQNALKVAKMFYDDYDGIDINMGCPKTFSVQGGMGVALLKDFGKVESILKTLKKNIDKPVSCKIRLFPDEKKSEELLRVIAKTSPDNVTIHARYPDDRPRDPAKPNLVKKMGEILHKENIPVCYNGDIFKFDDFERMKKESGCNSVMTARGALWNVSIFNKDGFKEQIFVANEIVDEFVKYNIPFQGAKYVSKRMFENQSKDPIFSLLNSSKNFLDLKRILRKSSQINESEKGNKESKIQKIFEINNNNDF